MKNTYLLSSLLLVFSHAILANPNDSESVWEVIPVESELEITDDDGNQKTIHPACAFDTIANPDPLGDDPLDNSFHFYYKQGKSDKLVVYFNGGGACWDDATCVASLVKGDRPTYNPTVHQANSPIGAGGIFDDENDNNPFKEWSKVFIPYCSGDIHVGSSEVTYLDVDGSLTGFPGAPIEVKHHGFDNFLAVREWIKGQFSTVENGKTDKLEKLLVTGSSAGGYGATLNFSYLQDTFPKTDAVLFADASEAVVTQGFLDSVFSVGGNWNVENTLPAILAEELGSFTEEGFNAEIFTKLTSSYPDSRFAQYTTASDFVQVAFLKIMTQLDAGNTDPNDWAFEFPEDYALFGSWNYRMEFSLDIIANNTDNYQYYIGAGSIHTILTDGFATSEVPHPFYDEHSAEEVSFTDWLNSLVNDKNFNEENLKYNN